MQARAGSELVLPSAAPGARFQRRAHHVHGGRQPRHEGPRLQHRFGGSHPSDSASQLTAHDVIPFSGVLGLLQGVLQLFCIVWLPQTL